MALFRITRQQRGPDPWLLHKMVLFALGAAVGFAGMILDRSWLVNVGIGVLVFGSLLRLVSPRGTVEDAADDVDDFSDTGTPAP